MAKIILSLSAGSPRAAFAALKKTVEAKYPDFKVITSDLDEEFPVVVRRPKTMRGTRSPSALPAFVEKTAQKLGLNIQFAEDDSDRGYEFLFTADNAAAGRAAPKTATPAPKTATPAPKTATPVRSDREASKKLRETQAVLRETLLALEKKLGKPETLKERDKVKAQLQKLRLKLRDARTGAA